MSKKVRYTNKPEVLTIEKGRIDKKDNYTVAINIEELPEKNGWDADVHSFWEYPSQLNEEDIIKNPEKYMNYIPSWQIDTIKKHYTDAVQNWMDTEVQTHGYDDIKSAVGYVGDPDPQFAAEGAACQSWRSRVWRACYNYLDSVLAKKEDIIPVEELIEKLPQMQWPNADSE